VTLLTASNISDKVAIKKGGNPTPYLY